MQVNKRVAVDGLIGEVGLSGNHANSPHSQLPYVVLTHNRFNDSSGWRLVFLSGRLQGLDPSF